MQKDWALKDALVGQAEDSVRQRQGEGQSSDGKTA